MVWVGWLIMGCTCLGFIRARRTPSRLLSPRMALITARMARSFSQTGTDMNCLPIHCSRNRLLALFALWLIPAALLHSQPVINTLAGYSGQGSAEGTSINARFFQPLGGAIDSAGNIFVA